MAIEKQKLIIQAQLLANDLKKNNPEKESLEWYLINNLNRYISSLNEATTAEQVKVATYIFRRFYLESMDWDTPLFIRCSNLAKLASSAIKKTS